MFPRILLIFFLHNILCISLNLTLQPDKCPRWAPKCKPGWTAPGIHQPSGNWHDLGCAGSRKQHTFINRSNWKLTTLCSDQIKMQGPNKTQYTVRKTFSYANLNDFRNFVNLFWYFLKCKRCKTIATNNLFWHLFVNSYSWVKSKNICQRLPHFICPCHSYIAF